MYLFSTWPPPRLNTTSGFSFVYVIVFRRSISIRRPNLFGMAQFTAEMEKNKRPPYWNFTLGFNFGYIAPIRMIICINLPNLIFFIGTSNAEI